MKNIIFLAVQGAGKGTYAKKLQEKYGYAHISTGDILRERAAVGDELGNQIKELIDIAKNRIDEAIDNIKNNRFDINPKVIGDRNIGCDFCKFKDICFVKKKNKVSIEPLEFGGEIDGLDK